MIPGCEAQVRNEAVKAINLVISVLLLSLITKIDHLLGVNLVNNY